MEILMDVYGNSVTGYICHRLSSENKKTTMLYSAKEMNTKEMITMT